MFTVVYGEVGAHTSRGTVHAAQRAESWSQRRVAAIGRSRLRVLVVARVLRRSRAQNGAAVVGSFGPRRAAGPRDVTPARYFIGPWRETKNETNCSSLLGLNQCLSLPKAELNKTTTSP